MGEGEAAQRWEEGMKRVRGKVGERERRMEGGREAERERPSPDSHSPPLINSSDRDWS